MEIWYYSRVREYVTRREALCLIFPPFCCLVSTVQDVYENTPEESSADVRASLTREERRASRGGYAKQMQQQFLSDAEARQRNVKKTVIDIPREGNTLTDTVGHSLGLEINDLV